MKRVLVVAYFFPPIPAIGGMRPLGFCRHLERYGWTPSVLTTDPASVFTPKTADPSLASRIPKGLSVTVVPHPNPLRDLLSARRAVAGAPGRGAGAGAGAAGGGAADRSTGGVGGLLRGAAERALESLFAFPDREAGWLGPASRRAASAPRGERPDVVFATGGPWTGLLVGRRAAARLGVPLVADFRDPWTANPFASPGEGGGFRKRAERAERGVWESAARIVWNTDAMLDSFRADHPEHAAKSVAITNGYDDDAVAGAGAAPRGPAAAPAGRLVELAHFGTVYGSRNPAPLLEAVSRAIEGGRLSPESVRLTFTGSWEVEGARCEALAARLEGRGVLLREPSVARDESLRRMAASRTLLLLQGGFPLQIPAKVYEYVASGRPIVYVGDRGATWRLVADHGLGRCCPDSVDEIERLVLDLASGAAPIDPPSRDAVARFHYGELAGRLAEVLDAAREGAPAR